MLPLELKVDTVWLAYESIETVQAYKHLPQPDDKMKIYKLNNLYHLVVGRCLYDLTDSQVSKSISQCPASIPREKFKLHR